MYFCLYRNRVVRVFPIWSGEDFPHREGTGRTWRDGAARARGGSKHQVPRAGLYTAHRRCLQPGNPPPGLMAIDGAVPSARKNNLRRNDDGLFFAPVELVRTAVPR